MCIIVHNYYNKPTTEIKWHTDGERDTTTQTNIYVGKKPQKTYKSHVNSILLCYSTENWMLIQVTKWSVHGFKFRKNVDILEWKSFFVFFVLFHII